MAPPKSKVWAYFEKCPDNVAKCKNCLKPIKFSGNTTNLFSHLKLAHPKLYSLCCPRNAKKDEPDCQSSSLSVSLPLLSSSSACSSSSDIRDSNFLTPSKRKEDIEKNEEVMKTFSPIVKSFQKVNEFVEGGPRYSVIVSHIIYFICKDNRPFSVIEGKGFKRLMKLLAPSFRIPAVSYIKKELCLKYTILWLQVSSQELEKRQRYVYCVIYGRKQ